MNNRVLLSKGLVPETLNLIQAAKVADEITPDDMIDILENENEVKYKKLDTGEYEIDTLSLLDYLDAFNEYCDKSSEQERLDYLMDLKQGNPNPRIPFHHNTNNQERNNE